MQSAFPLLAGLAVAAALAIGWVGYTASDDAAYHAAASVWIAHPPFAGDGHWATRFPLVLTLAAAIRAIGDGAAAMNATALFWYAIFLLVVRDMAARIGGVRAGWIAMMLLGTLPVVVANATTVSCDLAEASFLLLGIRLIGDAAMAGRGVARPVVAGVAFGLAILCRETSALALFGFAPMLLAGRPISRRALFATGLGCLALLAGEAAFQYALTGDPLHRWTLAFHHDSHIDRAANEEGNFLLHPAIDPLLVLLVNDDFALLFWLAIGAVALRFDRRLDRRGHMRLAILAMLALSTFLLVGALYSKLVLNPRYFMLPAVAAGIAVACWLATLRLRQALVVLAIGIGANLLMLGVENDHPRWPAEALVRAARDHPGRGIATDPETLHRARLPLAWNHLGAGVTTMQHQQSLTFAPRDWVPSDARIVALYPSPPTPIGRLVRMAGLESLVPGAAAHRLFAPNPDMALFARDRI